VTQWLLDRALARLPKDLRGRYEAEWRADLAQLSGLAAVRWALGLQRASSELRGERRWLALSTRALEAVAFGLAYWAAFVLRFGQDVPDRYADLFAQTVPFAVIGGVACLALTRHVVTGVGLATLVLIAYVAMVQPVLVNSVDGLNALRLPVGVCVIYALGAGTALTWLRYANAWARARSTATR